MMLAPPLPTYTHNQGVVKFNSQSRAPYYLLSNLCAARVTLTRYDLAFGPSLLMMCPHLGAWLDKLGSVSFPSIEHAWHSLKSTTLDTFLAFAEGGSLSQLTVDTWASLCPTTKASEVLRSIQFWHRNRSVGIVAKMAAKPERAARLGLDLDLDREHLPGDVEEGVWRVLLRLKYTQNATHRQALLGTGPATFLYEQDRGAAREGGSSHWGASIVKATGKFVGANKMGDFLMATRTELLAAPSAFQ